MTGRSASTCLHEMGILWSPSHMPDEACRHGKEMAIGMRMVAG